MQGTLIKKIFDVVSLEVVGFVLVEWISVFWIQNLRNGGQWCSFTNDINLPDNSPRLLVLLRCHPSGYLPP